MFGYTLLMSAQDIADFRLATGITEAQLSQEELDAILNSANVVGSIEKAAQIYYERKASEYSTLVNITESGSTRSLGDLYKNAKAMGEYWGSKATAAAGGATGTARTRAAVRES